MSRPIPRYTSSFWSLTLPLVLALLLHPTGHGQAETGGTTELEGRLNRADYRIRVPADWNGTLLVWARGYSGSVPEFAAVAPVGPDFEEFLLSQGYALAGSTYRNGGWAVKEGIQNTLALTNFFRGHVGQPERVVLWGESLGSVVALRSIEKYPGTYDGIIANCAVGAGTPATYDLALAFGLAYDVALGWPEAWGAVGDVRDDVRFGSEVVPVLIGQLRQPTNLGLFEFVRLVTDVPAEGFYSAPGNWLFSLMFFVTQGRGELESRAGGPIAQNLDHVYRLTEGEKAYLLSLGVDSEPLLAQMNARTTIEAAPSARLYVERFATYRGELTRPVLTLHTKVDGLVNVAQETVYRDTVIAAGRDDFLLQVYTESVGHCTFSPQQLFTVVLAMDFWLDSGVRPDALFFPEALGFDNTFAPPEWPLARH